MTDLYDDPSQMEPMLIADSRPAYARLIGKASELVEESSRLDAALAPQTAQGLAELVVGMNCYYSNLIEGHHTFPVDIEKALKGTKEDIGQKHLQTLAAAHIEADRWTGTQILDSRSIPGFLTDLHRHFCRQLPVEMLHLSDGSVMVGGEFRSRDVQVGVHAAPDHASLGKFIDRYASIYGQRLETADEGGAWKLDAILAAFAAHHRLTWIHPFLDGNGRVARITLDAMLRRCGLNGAGLWSMSRGLAKTADKYKAALADADMPRMGDIDGRGNLSESKLAEFCTYAIDTAIDQAKFVSGLFALDQIEHRVHAYFQRVRFDLKPESAYLYLHVFRFGEMERMEAGRITGLPERTARNVLAALLQEEFLLSDSPKGKVRVGFPLHALGSLFPNLYPAGDLDQTPAQKSRKRRNTNTASLPSTRRRGNPEGASA